MNDKLWQKYQDDFDKEWEDYFLDLDEKELAKESTQSQVSVKPDRNDEINKDDISNLTIALNTTQSVTEFLESIE